MGYSAPMPDSIESVVIDGMTYLLTADEGDHKIYGSYVENVEARDLFSGDAIKGVSPSFDCNTSGEAKDICDNGLQLTVGSSAVNYDDPTAPIIEKIVAFGGRGISIFKAKAAKVKPIWNSDLNLKKLCARRTLGLITLPKMKDLLRWTVHCTIPRMIMIFACFLKKCLTQTKMGVTIKETVLLVCVP